MAHKQDKLLDYQKAWSQKEMEAAEDNKERS